MSGPELISNGGFETAGGGGADVWANWTESANSGTIENETGSVNSGSDAAKLTSGASDDTRINQDITVSAGSRYWLNFYSRVDSGDGAGRYTVYDVDNTTYLATLASTGASTTSYEIVEYIFTAPTGCSTIRIYLYASGTNTDVAYFDDVSVRQATQHGILTSGHELTTN